MNNHLKLENLKAYQFSRELSKASWKIFIALDYKMKIIMGNQFIRSADSVGANIAEGYGRFHYLDKVRFYYNARGSLIETKHWLEIMYERKIISKNNCDQLLELTSDLGKTLNGLIGKNKTLPNS